MRALLVFAASMLAGCSVYPHEIPREYVSSDRYRLYNCDQVERESGRIRDRAAHIAAILDKFAQSDPPRNGIAFWPEYARLRGEHAALQQAAVVRECPVIAPVRMDAPAAATEIKP